MGRIKQPCCIGLADLKSIKLYVKIVALAVIQYWLLMALQAHETFLFPYLV
jgi:hypothetical protein